MAKPIVHTTRSLIRGVAKAWRKQYPKGCDADKETIWRKLQLLDGESASAEIVAAIIGNPSWTTLTCDGCGENVGALAVVGQEEDYESATARLCQPCLLAASDAITRALKAEASRREGKGAK